MCLPKSQKGDAKEGKAGIPPHSIKTDIYEPKEFHEEALLWADVDPLGK